MWRAMLADPKQQSPRLYNEANVEVPKLQFIDCPLEADSKSQSIPIDPHVKMPNFTAEINMFTACKHVIQPIPPTLQVRHC